MVTEIRDQFKGNKMVTNVTLNLARTKSESVAPKNGERGI